MKVNNPFITVGYESPEFFCDRVAETAELIDALENDRNVTLMAPRRYGKTGLIENAFHHLRKERGYKTVLIDLFPTQNLSDFIKLFATAVFKNLETSVEKALSAATQFLRSCRPTLTIDPSDMSHKFSFDIARNAAESTLSEIFDYLKSRHDRVVVALDEFQQITTFPEKGVEAALRSFVQTVPGVGFVFAGSRHHIMREMFSDAKRPFFQSTQKLHLDVIKRDSYRTFAQRFFSADGRTLPDETFDAIYDRFGGVTWYVQAVLNRLYGSSLKMPSVGDVDEVTAKLVGENSYDYRALLEALPGGSVRLLRAIAEEGSANAVTSSEFISRHGLKAPSSVSESLDRLLQSELIYKTDDGYIVYDRLFGAWLGSKKFFKYPLDD